MNEFSEVEARFDTDGGITVLRFTWRGHTQTVTGTGRQWPAVDGEHFLVMTLGERVFELVYAPDTGRWKIVSAPERNLTA